MRSFKTFAIASLAVSSVAAIIVGAAARGQEAPAAPGAAPARTENPTPRFTQLGDISTDAPATPRINVLYDAAGGNRALVNLFELNDGQLQQANAQLSQQTEALVAKYAEASQDDEREQIKAELSELLAKQFGIQQQLREDEVAQIEARVKKLRELIQKRKAAQQSIIERRLDQLLRDAEGLGWSPAPEAAHTQLIRTIRTSQIRGQGSLKPVDIRLPAAKR
ncbi:MAG TPA: hypothetical protein VGN42_21635 [Pirellulales bacterium]|jgi:Skp family chaperone for outer membrane proteins|nr:hypothetical protein [Pirellulales bacterium]